MKKFSDIPSVVHAFAHQTYDECGTYNGNVFYEYGVIYSYGKHFPMGRLLDDRTVLLTTNGYSVSTSNHKKKLRDAVNHLVRIHCVNPENPLGYQAIQTTLNEIEMKLREMAKRRSPYLAHADYCSALSMYESIERIREWEKRNKIRAQSWHAWDTWRDLSEPLKSAWKRMEKTLEKAKDDVASALAGLTAEQEAANKRREQRAALMLKRRREVSLAALAKWYEGYSLTAYVNGVLGYDGLRLSTCKEWVQTTQGLSVSAEDCVKAWPLIKAAYARLDSTGIHVDFDKKTQASARLGNFAPTGIVRDGRLIVGCHAFTRESVENLAKALGLS